MQHLAQGRRHLICVWLQGWGEPLKAEWPQLPARLAVAAVAHRSGAVRVCSGALLDLAAVPRPAADDAVQLTQVPRSRSPLLMGGPAAQCCSWAHGVGFASGAQLGDWVE